LDIVEVVKQRKSIRIFKPDPVPREILQEIMELALRAPSWANTQPWEFAIVSGAKLDEIRQGFLQHKGGNMCPDIGMPGKFPEPYNSRHRALSNRDSKVLKASGEAGEVTEWQPVQGSKMYGAPCVIYIYTDRSLYMQEDKVNAWPLFDCGLIAENIMLLAVNYGLGTVAAIQTVKYPDVLRSMLGIPDSKFIILGLAIGYPDWDHAINRMYSEREPLDSITRWYGFPNE
jgi:nitroreductase